ncbi:unnamed protein product [marine sediment metagenome]|uniref:Uncharacterized protein n=1 Tax=marine sediment metagenome TaxID=412755 RepID=X1VGF5_9ZZZZ
MESCKGTCIAKPTNSMWIWGVLILIIVAAGAAFFFWKMKKKQSKEVSPKKELKHRTEKFENRMSPKEYPEAPEVTKKLTNI